MLDINNLMTYNLDDVTTWYIIYQVFLITCLQLVLQLVLSVCFVYSAWMLINMNQGLRPLIEAWGCRQVSWCIHLGWLVLFRCIKPSHHAREMKASNGTILTLFYSYHSYHAWELICEFSDFIPHSIPAATNGWIGFSHNTAGMTWSRMQGNAIVQFLHSNEWTKIIQVITFFHLSLFIPDHL